MPDKITPEIFYKMFCDFVTGVVSFTIVNDLNIRSLGNYVNKKFRIRKELHDIFNKIRDNKDEDVHR